LKDLKKILQKYYTPSDALGNIDEANKLVQDLNGLREELNRRSWIIVAMIFFLYLLSLGITLFYLNKPEHIVSLFSAIGLGTGWGVAQMNKLWKESARINLIIVLCRSLNQNDMNNIIGKLIDSGFGKSDK
jgi:hypothetical protein